MYCHNITASLNFEPASNAFFKHTEFQGVLYSHHFTWRPHPGWFERIVWGELDLNEKRPSLVHRVRWALYAPYPLEYVVILRTSPMPPKKRERGGEKREKSSKQEREWATESAREQEKNGQKSKTGRKEVSWEKSDKEITNVRERNGRIKMAIKKERRGKKHKVTLVLYGNEHRCWRRTCLQFGGGFTVISVSSFCNLKIKGWLRGQAVFYLNRSKAPGVNMPTCLTWREEHTSTRCVF